MCCEQALVVAEAVTSLTVTAVYGRGRDVATRPCWTVSLLTLPRHGQSPSSCSDRLVDGGRRLDGRGRGRAVRSRGAVPTGFNNQWLSLNDRRTCGRARQARPGRVASTHDVQTQP